MNEYRATIYGIRKPGPADRIYYYTGETVEISSSSPFELLGRYLETTLAPETKKAVAKVFQNGRLVCTLSPYGIGVPNCVWQFNLGEAKNLALRNATILGVEGKTIDVIRSGNVHEIEFFTDPRVFDWVKVGTSNEVNEPELNLEEECEE